ncbi:MAG: DUF3604 domain-containing protein [Planctomycetes bacterium]|nr:DUF3604 domain-containing protein [Planctomycetota bacterium]
MRNKIGAAVRSSMFLLLCLALLATSALAQNSAGEPGRHAKKPNPLNNVYFGEQHLHTQNSPDAFAMGTRNTPDDAYNFAKGKAVKKNTSGKMVQKKTPYDWCAVTDHAEYFGVFPQFSDPNSDLMKKLKDNPMVKMIMSGDEKKGDEAFGKLAVTLTTNKPDQNFDDPVIIKSVWQKHIDITNRHYEPGKFTTLIAFEWTSIPINQNLHRNVFFRDDKGPVMPFSAFDSDRPEDLWTYIETQRDMGHEVFAIPHNGNISNGLMFAPRTSEGQPIDARYAERRARIEVATEIIQVKGQSDTHPALSPNDEFAGFEKQYGNLIGTNPPVLSRVNYGYVREALINGVGYQEYLGVNPFKYGIVSGADAHTAFSDNEEFNYTGAHGAVDDTAKKRLSGAGQTAGEAAMNFGTPGATGVWAPENTREAIFDAIKRKETFGTSGPLIRLRFFGGWDYAKGLTEDKDFVKKAYKGGVPMGGDLAKKPDKTKAPTFAVWALKDPESGNLDRVQIIKGWYQNGYPQEKIYDVAMSDNRNPDPKTGKVPPVGNTVNIKEAAYTNDIGDTQLSAVWTDPDFKPEHHAVYYVRVLEIPTPRWSTYDAKALGIAPPEGVAATIQERAWSSPIWYTPDAKLVKKAPAYPHLHQIFN